MEYFVGEKRRRIMPNAATLFSAYASLSATFTLLQQAFYQFVPPFVQAYLIALFKQIFFRKQPNKDLCEFIIEEGKGYSTNKVFEACQIYLCNKFSDSPNALKVIRTPNEEMIRFELAEGVKFSETYEGILLRWRFCYIAPSSSRNDEQNNEKSYFSLIFEKEHKKKICSSYLPHVVQTSEDVVREGKLLKLYDCNMKCYGGTGGKHSIDMTHPFTFDNLAMDPDDLDRFIRRKEFYRRVGKPWKRGYLLYGPPGTGKSSLIAAMANYLRFDVYDLQLENVDDSSLRELLPCIPSQSIIVVEDIDCSRAPSRKYSHRGYNDPKMSLAALLNFVDGLWSCCGDERLMVFTTNHKEKLDPALLRPGRMDMHIHMSYVTMEGFKVLAYNYLQVLNNHQLFGEIKTLLEDVDTSPAEVAEELMRSEDVDMALQGVVELLKRKKPEAEDAANLKLEVEKDGNDTSSESISS